MKKIIKYITTCFIFLVCTTSLYSQVKITGVVRDESGEPLPGAMVIVKNSKKVTTTDADGKFALDGMNSSDVFEVKFLGYLPATEKVGQKKHFDITLEVEAFQMKEVVAIGYGTMARRDLTGAVSSISGGDIVNTATSNFDQALAGRVAGVQVSSVDGTPGEGLNIVIRGGNSITGDNSPLYVVDGIPLENFDPATISTRDIKDIDVLKDASSTAIYGSRGANGVILITTKTGRIDGRTDISVNLNSGVSWIPSRIEVLGPYDYVRYQQEVAYAADGYTPGEKVRQFVNTWDNPELYRGVKGTSWQDEIFRTASYNKANFTISGGNKGTSIYYSGEYLYEKGTLLNTDFKKLTNNLKITHKIGKHTTLTAQLHYSHNQKGGLDVSGNNYTSVIRDALQYRPVEPINDDGMQVGGYDPEDEGFKYLYNPVKNLQNTDRQRKQDVTRGVVSLRRSFGKHFVLNLSANYQVSNSKNSVFYGEETQQGMRDNDGINGSVNQAKNYMLSSSNTLAYKLKKRQHNFDALVGVEATKQRSQTVYTKNTQFPTDIFGIDKIQLGTSPALPETYQGGNTMASAFGRINYGYKDKYLFQANFRADGSSKFNKDNRWGYFPSFSGAWRVTEEEFMKDFNWLSNLKLRAGWGLTGNNRISDYAHISYLNINSESGYVWGDGEKYTPGVYLANLGVPDLKWETTSHANVGLDLWLLRNRIDIVLDYYYKETSDLLLNADMALSTGFDRVQQNVGKVSNQGLEFTLNTVNIDIPDFKWTSSFNISFNRNKVLKLNDGQDAIYTNPNFYGPIAEHAYITKVGRPVGQIYGLQYDGLYSWNDFNYDATNGTFTLKPGIPDNGANVAPGNVKFVDQNNDGTINELDRVVLGNTNPKHIGGFTNDFVIAKNFDMQVFFQWSYGGKILNATNTAVGIAENKRYNVLAKVGDYWSPYHTEGDINGVRYETIFGMPPKGNQVDSRYVEDGSYLRLKSVSLGYTLPVSLTSKLKINKMRVYVSAQNLVTWTKYSGYDPDVSVGKYGALTPRLDYSAYPQSVTFMGGIDIMF
ncbi:TonB-dependent receptor [Dysgonomonas sp. 511]|uniref:SusC/RagA family TonB-linked outer membrane protein n=1 Tax=Dysgonomonas sp. 511 TaxID=2302930 RepID=UPI0013D38DE0|nr:TonB-dependent receptor [Dysgonomonas sp. 511]NDV78779.1 TonB-dependent receptor [Dysgonomonas sp. 511]